MGTIFFFTFLLLVMGGLLSGWTIRKCSHCNGELTQSNPGISPFLRVSPAMVLILLSSVCWKLVQDSNTRFTACVFTIGISALILIFVIYFAGNVSKQHFEPVIHADASQILALSSFFSYG
jgi:hypothetical protein